LGIRPEQDNRDASTQVSVSEIGVPQARRPRLVLVLVWSRDEAKRIGELISLPVSTGLRSFTIGRTDRADKDGREALILCQLRPHGIRTTGPFRAAHISRRQLLLSIDAHGSVSVERIARTRLLVNGRPVDRAALSPGDLVEVERRFTLLVSTRPPSWPNEALVGDDFTFGEPDRDGLVGESPVVWELRRRIAFVSPRGGHVLVHGPSGSGKELAVLAIHRGSERGVAPLVSRNASTIPEGLLDAELFGNLKNFPNPGMPDRPGLFGQAKDSSLFLDEIGELPFAMQAHLLRVMDLGEYQRLGEARTRRTNARVLGATNRELASLKHDVLARFFHRIEVEGLNNRREDIPLLVRHLLRGIARDNPDLGARFFEGTEPRLSAALMEALLRHPYSTHTRELMELLWSSAGASSGQILLPQGPLDPAAADDHQSSRGCADIHAITRKEVEQALAAAGGVQERAWRALGLRSRYQLRRLLKKFAITSS